MTPEEKARMAQLCQQIEVEKDHDKFIELVRELGELLARIEHRFDANPPAKTKTH
jgi:hypothetical protein